MVSFVGNQSRTDQVGSVAVQSRLLVYFATLRWPFHGNRREGRAALFSCYCLCETPWCQAPSLFIAGEPDPSNYHPSHVKVLISPKNQKCTWLIVSISRFLILPRITHTTPRCATLANCIQQFWLSPIRTMFQSEIIKCSTDSSESCGEVWGLQSLEEYCVRAAIRIDTQRILSSCVA